METASTLLCFYLKSSTPIFTTTLTSDDHRLPLVLEDVRMVRHGNTVFVHLRSAFEWERAKYFLGVEEPEVRLAPFSAA